MLFANIFQRILLQAAPIEWTLPVIAVIAVLSAVILWGVLTAFYKIYCRFYRDSDKNRKTVQATFLRFQHFQGKVGMEDKTRLITRNMPVMLEHCRVVFWVEELNKELRFLVPVDSEAANWQPNQSGKLTYSGKRYIQFQED